MDRKLKLLAVVVMMTSLMLLIGGAVRASHDAITVHCVNVTASDPRFASCQDQHSTIQDAIDHVDPGEEVLVGAGTYDEQVVISASLTLEGVGPGDTIIQPSSISANTTNLSSGDPIAAIVLVGGAADVAVTDLTVDGLDAAFNSCSPGYVGIFYRASSGTIENTEVINVHHPSAPGCQTVLGIFVQGGTGGTGLRPDVALRNNVVENYGKNGITANEPGTFVRVANNTVTGRGPVGPGDAAQNGVQIGFGARGRVWGNTISDNFYLPDDFTACGLLFFQAGGGVAWSRGNTFDSNEQNVCITREGPSGSGPLPSFVYVR